MADNLQEQLYQKIREGLLAGRFQPGERLKIRDLAAEWGTSPMPVRAALQRLVAEGALEGEPQRSFEERRAKHSALRDVAGMLRSFDYARHTALHQTAQGSVELERLAPGARHWERHIRQAFLGAYRQVVVAGGLYANAAAFDDASALLDLFELEKALYELRYELDNRPDWVGVPLAGIAALAGVEH